VSKDSTSTQSTTDTVGSAATHKSTSRGPRRSSPGSQPIPFKIQCGGFTAVERLNTGSFGEVWRGVSAESKDEVAIKFELLTEKQPHLIQEAQVLEILCEDSFPQGVAQCFNFSRQGSFYCMVMEKLGHSLRDRAVACGGHLSLQSTILVAAQVIQRVEYLHSKGVIHRDIKPENFMFGLGERVHHVYLIDFGLAKKYWEAGADGKGKHIPLKGGYRQGGTARYISPNAHQGFEQSRRDDLESIGYMFLHLCKGTLPWSSLDVWANGYADRVAAMKINLPLNEICQGAPAEFEEYMDYCRRLGFTERPNYTKLYNLLQTSREPGLQDYEFQWFKRGDADFDPVKLEPLDTRINHTQPDDYIPRKRNFLAGLLSGFRRGSSKSDPTYTQATGFRRKSTGSIEDTKGRKSKDLSKVVPV
jgi:serine/threonine protein kinase